MSTAAKLMEMGEIKGYEKGKDEGKEEAMIETCKKLLLSGADLKFVAKITSLSIERIKEIQAGMGRE